MFYTDRNYALKGKAQEMHFSDLLDHISFQGAGKPVGNGLAYLRLTDEVTEAREGKWLVLVSAPTFHSLLEPDSFWLQSQLYTCPSLSSLYLRRSAHQQVDAGDLSGKTVPSWLCCHLMYLSLPSSLLFPKPQAIPPLPWACGRMADDRPLSELNVRPPPHFGRRIWAPELPGPLQT